MESCQTKLDGECRAYNNIKLAEINQPSCYISVPDIVIADTVVANELAAVQSKSVENLNCLNYTLNCKNTCDRSPSCFEPIAFEGLSGIKFSQNKLRFDLIQPEFEELLAEVLTMGCKKYSPNNWQKLKNAEEEYYAALRRHLSLYRKGESCNEESGLSHLGHIAANVMFLLHFEQQANTKKGDM